MDEATKEDGIRNQGHKVDGSIILEEEPPQPPLSIEQLSKDPCKVLEQPLQHVLDQSLGKPSETPMNDHLLDISLIPLNLKDSEATVPLLIFSTKGSFVPPPPSPLLLSFNEL